MFDRIKPMFRGGAANNAAAPDAEIAEMNEVHGSADRKDAFDNNEKETGSGDASSTDDSVPSPDAEEGVRRAEAITLVWTRWSLILAYVLCVSIPKRCVHC